MPHLDAEAPSLSIPQGGQRYAIAALSDSTQAFPLALQAVPGEYEISVDQFNVDLFIRNQQLNNPTTQQPYLHLIDRVTGADIDLLRDSSYKFRASGSDAARFLVKLASGNSQWSMVNGQFAYHDGDRIVIDGSGTLEVYDLMGRKLFDVDIHNSQFEIHNSKFPAAGVYILRLGGQTQKIVIR